MCIRDSILAVPNLQKQADSGGLGFQHTQAECAPAALGVLAETAEFELHQVSRARDMGHFLQDLAVINPGQARILEHALVLCGEAGAIDCGKRFGQCHAAQVRSYTHLRAHETDSYLVCRLLLEKKKK